MANGIPFPKKRRLHNVKHPFTLSDLLKPWKLNCKTDSFKNLSIYEITTMSSLRQFHISIGLHVYLQYTHLTCLDEQPCEIHRVYA